MAEPALSPILHDASAEALRPLRDVLENLGGELEQLRALGLRVEGAICQIAVRAAIDPGIIVELQQLDMVLQQLGNLRAYVGRLALECNPTEKVSIAAALDQVTLAELRSRLAGAGEEDLTDESGWEIL